MKKLTVKKQVELFAQDCKLINLQYEYSGFTGTEKWAIIKMCIRDRTKTVLNSNMPTNRRMSFVISFISFPR